MLALNKAIINRSKKEQHSSKAQMANALSYSLLKTICADCDYFLTVGRLLPFLPVPLSLIYNSCPSLFHYFFVTS